jgi:chromate reductase
LLQQPEAFVRYREGVFAEDGSVTDESVAKFLGDFVDKYLEWVKRFIA